MNIIPIDLSALTDAEKALFFEYRDVLSASWTEVVCFYLRYSSDRQTEQSIEGQLRDLLMYCRLHAYRVAAIYVDRAISAHASMEKRPAFQMMLADSATSVWKTVLVYKLDRFARNREDSMVARIRLRKNGCRVESAKENISKNPEGIILESVLEGINEYYSEELRQKVMRGNRESAMKGQTLGGVTPFGYKTENKRLVPDPMTAPVVQEIFTRYAAGDRLVSIARDLNQRGYRTTKGHPFGKSSFKTIFRNTRYIGVYKYMDITKEDPSLRIVSDEQWEAVQSKLSDTASAPGRGKARNPYLLSGKLFCGHCGVPMVGECGRGRHGQTYYYYSCANRKGKKSCDKKPVPKEWIEHIVAEDAAALLTDDFIEDVAEKAAQQSEADFRANTRIPALESQIADIDSRIRNLTKAIETSGSALDVLVSRLQELTTQKSALEAELRSESAGVIHLTKEMVIFFLEGVRDKIIQPENRDAILIRMFVNSVMLYDDGPGFFKFETAYNLTGIPQKTYKIPINSASAELQKCSDFGRSGVPLDANSNQIQVVGLIFIQTKRHALP